MKSITHIADLVPDHKNARKHNPRNIGMIVDALHEVGAARSIVIDEDGRILAGNGTIDAAAEAGIERVQVVEADGETIVAVRRTGLTEAQKARLALFDNRASDTAEWDASVLAELAQEGVKLDDLWVTDELDALLASVSATPEPGDGGDEFDTTPEDGPTTVQLGDLWALGPHRLLCGDSTKAEDVARLMAGEKADCVFTSPPYAVGVDYGAYQDTIDNLRKMLPSLSRLWLDAVVDGGFAVVNFGDIVGAREIVGEDEPCEYPMALEYWPVFRADGWLLWSRRAWCKPNARCASPWSIQSNRAAADFEHIWTWKKPGKAIAVRTDGQFTSGRGWFDTSRLEGVDIGKETHGAGMPISAALWMLTVHSRAKSIVLEPFCGTGTTLIASHRLERKCRAMELSPSFCDVILKRYTAETGEEPKLLERANGTA